MRSIPPIFQQILCLALLASSFLITGCANREERIARALSKADEARQKEQISEALNILGKASLKIPDSAALQEALANTYLEGNDPQSAIVAFQKAIELDETRQRLWVTIADLNQRLGEELASAEALERYLESFPDDFLAWKNYAAIHENRGDRNAAIQALLEWNRIRPSAGPALKLGQLFNNMGNLPQARSWISQAAAYVNDPGSQDALASLIELEINLQQYLPASTWLDQYHSRYGAQSNDPRIVAAQDTIQRWRQAQIEITEAAAALEERRKELERQNQEALEREARARQEREALLAEQARIAQEAIESPPAPVVEDSSPQTDETPVGSDSALPPIGQPIPDSQPDLEPEPAETNYLLAARQAAALSNTQEAIDLYWRALGPGVDNPEIWFELSSLYKETRNWVDAEACILEAKRRDPRSPVIAASYLSIAAQTQSASQFASGADALVTLFPNDASVALAYARGLQATNAPASRVADSYERFLNIAQPGQDGYDEARQFLRR